MKRIKKMMMLVVLVAFTLLLVSCKKADTTPLFFVYDLNPENLVVDELNTNENIDDIKFYEVNKATQTNKHGVARAKITFLFDGEDEALTLDEISDKNLNIKDAYAKNYTYNLRKEYKVKKEDKLFEQQIVITQITKDSDYETSYIKFFEFNDKDSITTNGAILSDTFVFDGSNVSFYEVTKNGVKEIDFNEIEWQEKFPEPDELIEGKKWVNHKEFNLVGNYNNVEFDFNLYLSSRDTPLSTKTASFWNWIFLQIPIAFLMSFIGKISGGSFAVAIIFTTIIVRTIAWPIYAKTNDMSMKMSLAQPDIDRLNRKYATRKDPESQQRMQMEMMAIYKKHNINMFGCLLPILQMPIFLAMFQVVRRITIPGGQFYQNVTNTKFFGTDLANGKIVAKIIFTALVGLTMFALQRISQKKPSYAKNQPQSQKTEQAQQTEQTMKMVSVMMIIMMMFTSYAAPGTSLSFYWIIGNIYSIGQTLFNRYLNEKKYAELQEKKLYGKSRETIDAKFKEKSGK